ncbi:hypothetical protein BDV06DRAFT_77351 [Aspergillus oleicola]
MPRLATGLVLQAYKHDRMLPLLLRECRSLDTAMNELRWLRDRALRTLELRSRGKRHEMKHAAVGWRNLLRTMCLARSRGVPLQYILGDQPFGNLDIKCAKGVLIPRHETEAITYHTADLVLKRMSPSKWRNSRKTLRILDLCTGTGCISLLLHSLLSPHFSQLSIIGIDISATAVSLANKNIHRNVSLGNLSQHALADVVFRCSNVLDYNRDGSSALKNSFGSTPESSSSTGSWCDILISNPPYVSSYEYHDGTTSRSVRMFEPKIALVPPEGVPPSIVNSGHDQHEDLFYSHIASLILGSQARLAVLECGNRLQANRVAALCQEVFGKHNCMSHVVVDIWPVTETDSCAVIVHNRGTC